MKAVSHCANSTITEAWFILQGAPAKYDEDEIGSLNTEAKKRFPDLMRKPSVVLTHRTEQPQQPFWTSQLAWNGLKNQARIGHKYLSVHSLCGPSTPYEGFTKSLRPAIESWLSIFNEKIAKPENFVISNIAFGYLNTFTFPSKKFDVSKYFGVNLAIEIEDMGIALTKAESDFRLILSKHKATSDVTLGITSNSDGKSLTVTTAVVTNRDVSKKLTISDSVKIFEHISDLKEASKEVFFGFATPHTRDEIMRAEYVG